MEAAYTKKTAVVVLDDSEVLLLMRALTELRYSNESKYMTGSMLVNLAGLSQEWRNMSVDMSSPKPERVSQVLDIPFVMSRIVKELYGPECSWEVY